MHFKNSFGKGRAEIPPQKMKAGQTAEYGRESPGHIYNIPNVWARENIQDGVNVT